MKKKLLLISVMVLSLLLGACKTVETYKFLNPEDDISEIAIVALSFSDNGDLIETELRRIEDANAFLDNFRRISCYKYFGDPVGATPEGVEDTVIKILYANSEYELINWMGQSKFTSEKGFSYYAGYRVLDEQQFESFIANALLG